MSRFIFRITHWENIQHYLRDGVIRAKDIPPLQAGYRVSDPGIISRRGIDISNVVGFPINEYVPFYFSPLTTMAYSIAKGNVKVLDQRDRVVSDSSSKDMALIVARVDEVAASTEYKFTNAACNTAMPPEVYDDIQVLEQTIKWDLFDDGSVKGRIPEIGYQGSTRYCSDSDKDPRYHNRKKDRMAEFMVHREFPMSLCCAIVTFTAEQAIILQASVTPTSLNIPVLHNPNCFFT